MENIQVTTPQYPDFGALLESVRESVMETDRFLRESDERHRKMQIERDEKWKAEQNERDAKWKAEQDERDAKWKAEQYERDAKWEKERQESDARWKAEQNERDTKWEKERQERDAKWKAEDDERDERISSISMETKKAIKEMKNVFTTQWGRLVEALCKPAAFKLFKKEGIEIDRIYEGIHKAKVDGQDVMEIDVALCDTSVAVIVEVKTRCGSHDIDYFLSQMEHCKEWYKEFADKQLLVAVAAINYDTGAIEYAHKKGLYVLELTGEETFALSAPNNPKSF